MSYSQAWFEFPEAQTGLACSETQEKHESYLSSPWLQNSGRKSTGKPGSSSIFEGRARLAY
jgi:hypothetical protein